MTELKKAIDIEKIKKAMQNKKFVTIIGILMLVLGVVMSYSATMMTNAGFDSLGTIFKTWSQIFILIFIGLFAYTMFALDKQLTENFKKKKEDLSKKITGTTEKETIQTIPETPKEI
jgi:amino acid transporter